jgi:hypothetical protein
MLRTIVLLEKMSVRVVQTLSLLAEDRPNRVSPPRLIAGSDMA